MKHIACRVAKHNMQFIVRYLSKEKMSGLFKLAIAIAVVSSNTIFVPLSSGQMDKQGRGSGEGKIERHTKRATENPPSQTKSTRVTEVTKSRVVTALKPQTPTKKNSSQGDRGQGRDGTSTSAGVQVKTKSSVASILGSSAGTKPKPNVTKKK